MASRGDNAKKGSIITTLHGIIVFHGIKVKYLKQEVEKTSLILEEHKLFLKIKGFSIMTNEWIDRRRRTILNFLVNSLKKTTFFEVD